MTTAADSNVVNKKIAEAYVDPSTLVLDPEKLDKSLLDRMPQPTGWRMLVLPYAGKAKTDGGIVLKKQTTDREALATVVAYVVKKDRYAITTNLDMEKHLGAKKSSGF